MSHSNPQADADQDYQKSYATALRLLARREHSVLELRRKLAGRRLDEGVIGQVLEELVAGNLLSDRRFAEVYVRSRQERGYGPLRIRAELRERGISDALIEEYLSAPSGGWLASAEHQRSKRFGRELPADYRERARQSRFLQQRGFSGEHIRSLFDSD